MPRFSASVKRDAEVEPTSGRERGTCDDGVKRDECSFYGSVPGGRAPAATNASEGPRPSLEELQSIVESPKPTYENIHYPGQ